MMIVPCPDTSVGAPGAGPFALALLDDLAAGPVADLDGLHKLAARRQKAVPDDRRDKRQRAHVLHKRITRLGSAGCMGCSRCTASETCLCSDALHAAVCNIRL